ncbi:ATP-binding cassette domain-containing protein [Rhodococcus sp. C26F]
MPAELRSLTVHIDTGRWSETVLTEVSLEVPAGCITALLGGPGAGKTMITYALTDRLPVTAQITGEVLIEGTVGYIPQDGIGAFVPDRTVGEQLRALSSSRASGPSLERVRRPTIRSTHSSLCRHTIRLGTFSARLSRRPCSLLPTF